MKVGSRNKIFGKRGDNVVIDGCNKVFISVGIVEKNFESFNEMLVSFENLVLGKTIGRPVSIGDQLIELHGNLEFPIPFGPLKVLKVIENGSEIEMGIIGRNTKIEVDIQKI